MYRVVTRGLLSRILHCYPVQFHLYSIHFLRKAGFCSSCNILAGCHMNIEMLLSGLIPVNAFRNPLNSSSLQLSPNNCDVKLLITPSFLIIHLCSLYTTCLLHSQRKKHTIPRWHLPCFPHKPHLPTSNVTHREARISHKFYVLEKFTLGLQEIRGQGR